MVVLVQPHVIKQQEILDACSTCFGYMDKYCEVVRGSGGEVLRILGFQVREAKVVPVRFRVRMLGRFAGHEKSPTMCGDPMF